MLLKSDQSLKYSFALRSHPFWQAKLKKKRSQASRNSFICKYFTSIITVFEEMSILNQGKNNHAF